MKIASPAVTDGEGCQALPLLGPQPLSPGRKDTAGVTQSTGVSPELRHPLPGGHQPAGVGGQAGRDRAAPPSPAWCRVGWGTPGGLRTTQGGPHAAWPFGASCPHPPPVSVPALKGPSSLHCGQRGRRGGGERCPLQSLGVSSETDGTVPLTPVTPAPHATWTLGGRKPDQRRML